MILSPIYHGYIMKLSDKAKEDIRKLTHNLSNQPSVDGYTCPFAYCIGIIKNGRCGSCKIIVESESDLSIGIKVWIDYSNSWTFSGIDLAEIYERERIRNKTQG